MRSDILVFNSFLYLIMLCKIATENKVILHVHMIAMLADSLAKESTFYYNVWKKYYINF